MKTGVKLTVLALASTLSLFASTSYAATAAASVSAQIATTLTVTKNTDLNFGIIQAPTVGSIIVTVDTSSARSLNQNGATGGALVAGIAPSAIDYTVTGASGATVTLSLDTATPAGGTGVSFTLNTNSTALGTCTIGTDCDNKKIAGQVTVGTTAAGSDTPVSGSVTIQAVYA
ncbi:MAG: hypothetical protein K0S29_781 [Gammaproteobacteria bacterium]|jgi:hypothetical protein|nr:hypothetical protein [Gammaproteobacteria bacterium]